MAAVAPMVRRCCATIRRCVTAMNGMPWWFAHHLPALGAARPLESVDPGGAIIAAIPAAHVIGCVVHMAASTASRCRAPRARPALHHRRGVRRARRRGSSASPTRCAARGLDVEVSPAIQRDIWYKLWGNMTMNPVSALTGATMDRILDDPLVDALLPRGDGARRRRSARAIGCPVEQIGRGPAEDHAHARRGAHVDAAGRRSGTAAGNRRAAVVGARDRRACRHRHAELDALTGLVRLKARTLGLYPPASPGDERNPQ